jgi:hypothetical protein
MRQILYKFSILSLLLFSLLLATSCESDESTQEPARLEIGADQSEIASTYEGAHLSDVYVIHNQGCNKIIEDEGSASHGALPVDWVVQPIDPRFDNDPMIQDYTQAFESHEVTNTSIIITDSRGSREYNFNKDGSFWRWLSYPSVSETIVYFNNEGYKGYSRLVFSEGELCYQSSHILRPDPHEIMTAIDEAVFGETAEEESSEPSGGEEILKEEEPQESSQPVEAETESNLPFNIAYNGGFCGEKESYPYRWTVGLIQDKTGHINGTIRFHDCPNGGQAVHRLTGQISDETIDTVQLQGTKSESWGDLDESSPDSQVFTIRLGYPPSPNLAG